MHQCPEVLRVSARAGARSLELQHYVLEVLRWTDKRQQLPQASALLLALASLNRLQRLGLFSHIAADDILGLVAQI